MEFFSPGHLIVLAVVVAVLFFGWKQLPDMSRSLGRSLRIFKTEIKGMTEDDKAREAKDEPAAPRELPRAEVQRAEVKRVEVVKQPAQQQQPQAAPRPRPRPMPSQSAGTRSD